MVNNIIWRPISDPKSRRNDPVIGYEMYMGEWPLPLVEISRVKTHWSGYSTIFGVISHAPLAKIRQEMEREHQDFARQINLIPFG